MAWSSADIPLGERTLYTADKPIIVALNAIESPQIARWDANGSLADGADIAATDWPTTRAYDRLTGLRTKPNAAATTQYLCFQLAATPEDFDCLFILDHNLGTIGGVTVSLEIADDNTFTTNLTQIESRAPGSSNKRIASFLLNHTGGAVQRYSGVPYLRLKMTKGSSFTPEIGEVWLGRRVQLRYKANVPWDPSHFVSDVADHVTRSGILTRTIRHRGKRIIEASFNPDVAADKTDLITWFQDTNHGSKPFIWCEDPATTPSDYNVMTLDDAELVFPSVGPFEREIQIKATENGPDFLELGV